MAFAVSVKRLFTSKWYHLLLMSSISTIFLSHISKLRFTDVFISSNCLFTEASWCWTTWVSSFASLARVVSPLNNSYIFYCNIPHLFSLSVPKSVRLMLPMNPNGALLLTVEVLGVGIVSDSSTSFVVSIRLSYRILVALFISSMKYILFTNESHSSR